MFMLLERIDPPATQTPVALKAGDDCPHCDWTASITFVSGCEPHSTDHLQCYNCDSTYCIQSPPAPVIPKPAARTPVTDSRFKLQQFPDYEFMSDGTPVRVMTRLSGPQPATGIVEPTRTSNKSRYYSLASATGRVIITDTKLRDLIAAGSFEPADFFTIDDFPHVKFDTAGGAHSTVRSIQLDCKPLETASGTVRRYRLYSKSRDAYVWFTDAAARRYNDGRCSLTTAEVPTDCVLMGDEFPDFAVDIFSGQPYRIQSKRIAIYAPVKCNMRADGKFFIQNYAGKRHLFTPKQLLEYVAQNTAS